MNKRRIIDDLPKLYHTFFPDFFENLVPVEVFSDCSNCSMICKGNKSNMALKPFNEKTKCCTYIPNIPNYLVGNILSEDNTLAQIGKERITNTIEKRTDVTPKGIAPPKIFGLLYDKFKKNGFGHSDKFVCPYYESESGNCTVWKYRTSDCSTYFCKYISNEKGKEFWQHLLVYLKHTEQSLIDYALLKLNFDSTVLFGIPKELSVEEIDGKTISEADYEKNWKDLKTNEKDFFIASYELIRGLSKKEFASIVGVKGNVFLKRLEYSYQSMMHIPSKLIKNKHAKFEEAVNGEYIVRIDLIDTKFKLDKEILEIFDGKKTNEENINSLIDKNIEVDMELIRTLYNYDILQDINFK